MRHINLQTEAFNSRQALALTEISQRQLVYWDEQGIVRPSLNPASGRGSRRLYSYLDLLALKTVCQLKSEGLSLQKIRRCVAYLRRHKPNVSQPLSFFELIVCGDTVVIAEDEQQYLDVLKRPGQTAIKHVVDVAMLNRQLEEAVLRLSAKRIEEVAIGDFAYQVEIEPDDEEGGYVASVAGLPGCITEGDTLEETLENAKDAIVGWLDAREQLRREGVDVPISVRKWKQKTA